MDICRTNWSTYMSYISMRQRCEYSKNIGFKQYGGRGIKVCDRWREAFKNFLEDMGPRPDGSSLDRIDCDGNYEPGNCRWATRKEQNNNKTCTYRFTDENGQSVLLKEYAQRHGVKYKTALYRFKKGHHPLHAVKPGPKPRST